MKNLKMRCMSCFLAVSIIFTMFPLNYYAVQGEAVNKSITANSTQDNAGIIYGDVNGDGTVDKLDYEALKNLILTAKSGNPNVKIAADVNGDGKVNLLDYLLMKRYLAGEFKKFPVEEKLKSIEITSPAKKTVYNIGEPLDITGLEVTGTECNGTQIVKPIETKNITGFDSSKAANDQVLTINIDGKTTTYTIDIIGQSVKKISDYMRPTVSLNMSQRNAKVNEQVTLTVTASDDTSVKSKYLRINGKDITIDSNGSAVYTPAVPDVYTVEAFAQDPSGNIGYDSKTLIISDGTKTASPTVSITSPVLKDCVTGSTGVVGTVSDDNLAKYELEYSPKNENRFIKFAEGTSQVQNAQLGIFDPISLNNGLYDIRLKAYDKSGNISSTSVTVWVQAKLRQGETSLSYDDLSIPCSGMNLDVARSYNASDKSQGDFGMGWTLNIANIKLSKTVDTLNRGWNIGPVGVSLYVLDNEQPHYVIINYPNGTSDKFRMQLTPNNCTALPVTGNVNYTAQGGTKSKLEALGTDNSYYVMYSEANTSQGPAILYTGDPDDLEFNEYSVTGFKLTRQDGTIIMFDSDGKIQSMQDSNGNTITIKQTGITHSNGKSISFTRDSKGRITKAKDMKGNTVSYSYDNYDDLVTATNAAGYTKKYIYDSEHRLTDVINNDGIRTTKNYYDLRGRRTVTIDAYNNINNVDYDDTAHKETLVNRNGISTIVQYDSKSNVDSIMDEQNNKTTYTYDTDGKKQTETKIDVNNKLISKYTYAYDKDNNMISKTDDSGNNVGLSYNSMGKILTIKDLQGNLINNNIYDDTTGNLKETDDPAQKPIGFEYGTNGNVKSITDQLGAKIQCGYNEKGELTSETDATGKIISFSYDENGRCTSNSTTVKTAQGIQTLSTQNQYDSLGNIIQTTDAKGNISKAEYNNEFGKISAYIDKKSQRTEYKYDYLGNLIEIKYPDGTFENFTYSPEGWNLTAKNREGKVTKFEYDGVGRVEKVTYPNLSYKTVEYDANGNVKKERDQLENTTLYGYDSLNRNTTITDALGNVTTFEYSSSTIKNSTNPLKMIDAKKNEYNFEYDANGRRTKTIYPGGKISESVGYDAAGNILTQTDKAGKVTKYNYDNIGRLKTVTDSMLHTWQYEYDDAGNLTKITDPKLHVTQYEYDNLGREKKKTLPLGMSESTDYDAEGNIQSKTNFNGNTISYGYDENERLTQKTLADNSIVKFTYTYDGNIKTVTDSTGVTSYTYDDMYGLKSRKNPDGSVISYNYDIRGNCTEVKTAGGKTGYTYDELNRVKTVITAEGTTTYGYDAAGNREKVTYPNGLKIKYLYDAMNRLYRVETLNSSEQTISWYEYKLGDAGNKLGITESSGRSVDFGYDDAYRLTSEAIKNPDGSTINKSYTYDAAGNRLSMTDGSGTTSYKYDDNDRLTNEGNISYDYDGSGSLKTKTGVNGAKAEYSYNFDNKLIKEKSTDVKGITTEEYKYDWAGNRIQKTTNEVNTINYTVDSNTAYSNVIEERDSIGKLLCYYNYGDGDLISQKRNGIANYYMYDGCSSVRALSDASGKITDTYTYDAFGNMLSKTGTTTNSYLYDGEQYDANTGFYYLRARYMNPSNGRFISADSYSGSIYDPKSLHKYMYANASPVNYTDPSGNESLGELMGAIDISSILDQVIGLNIRCLFKSLAKNVIVGAIGGGLYGGVDAFLGGANAEQILKNILEGGISGAVFGALLILPIIRPLILAYGMASGAESVVESLEKGNYVQAAFRAMAVAGAVRSVDSGTFDCNACFTGNTLIYTKDGCKEIKDIKAGDEVYSENPETGEKGLKKVKDVFVKEVKTEVHITAGDEKIDTTPSHPFWVVGKGWTEAGDIKTGDKLQLYSGKIIEVTDVCVEHLDKPIKVYNFEVEDWHTYFVSDAGVFVHNSCDVPEGEGEANSNGVFENAPYHGKTNNSVKNKAPNNGQAALDNSVPLNAETTPRRIGVSDGEIVVLDQTTDGVFHGHVRSWDELTPKMRSVLQKGGLVDKKGNVIQK